MVGLWERAFNIWLDAGSRVALVAVLNGPRIPSCRGSEGYALALSKTYRMSAHRFHSL
jgi:hypothetical protein